MRVEVAISECLVILRCANKGWKFYPVFQGKKVAIQKVPLPEHQATFLKT